MQSSRSGSFGLQSLRDRDLVQVAVPERTIHHIFESAPSNLSNACRTYAASAFSKISKAIKTKQHLVSGVSL